MRAIIFLLVFIVTFTAKSHQESCPKTFCVTIVDVGRTVTRAHAYAFDVEHGFPINIRELWVNKINTGLLIIGHNSKTVDLHLRKLFLGAPGPYPVYFYASGGIRLVPIVRQQKIFALIKLWFANSGLVLKDIKTISGTEEGVFAWLAVNYQLGTLKHKSAEVAVLDMGAASVQIIVPVKRNSNFFSPDFVEFSLYGRVFRLFSHSFLGLGETEIIHQFLDARACFANNFELSTGQAAMGNAFTCEAQVALLLNSVHKVNFLIRDVLIDNPQLSWYVVGGLVRLVNSKLFQLQQPFTSQELLDKANAQICQQSWSALAASFPKNERLYSFCLVSAYYFALLIDGYGLTPQTNLKFLGANQNLDWTLGAVLRLQQF